MGLLDIRNHITASLESGMTREEVFHQLVKGRPGDIAKIAFAVASVPKEELRQKYLRINAVLFLTLIGVSIAALIAELPINFQDSTLFILLRVGIPLLLSYFVYHFHGGVYRLIGFWCFFDLLEILLLGNYTSIAGASRAFLLALAVAFAVRISMKVFPHLRFFGPKQDNLGRYFL